MTQCKAKTPTDPADSKRYVEGSLDLELIMTMDNIKCQSNLLIGLDKMSKICIY